MSSSETPSPYRTTLIQSTSKSTLPSDLHEIIIQACRSAFLDSKKDTFTIALSGGSLPSFLSGLTESFRSNNIDPNYDKWHVLLADERAVPSTDNDSNLKSLKEKFLSETCIPETQVYGIDETLLPSDNNTMEELALSYEEKVVKPLLEKSNDKKIDVALLGFGPDGHTCSLFPSHRLLKEDTKLVASITDSPKPPPNRITLTFPVLNQMTKLVIFVGAGSSKGVILKDSFDETLVEKECGGGGAGGGKRYDAFLVDPPPYPCGMVRPTGADDDDDTSGVVWIIDYDAAKGAGWSSSE